MLGNEVELTQRMSTFLLLMTIRTNKIYRFRNRKPLNTHTHTRARARAHAQNNMYVFKAKGYEITKRNYYTHIAEKMVEIINLVLVENMNYFMM